MMTYLIKSPAYRQRRWNHPSYVAPVRYRTSQPTVPANINETDEAFELSLAAPGYQREQFHISLDKEVLTIKAILPKVEGEDQPKVKGFGSQEFERNFHLPDTIDFEAIKASYEQGVLTVLLPKTDPKPQSRSISVQ